MKTIALSKHGRTEIPYCEHFVNYYRITWWDQDRYRITAVGSDWKEPQSYMYVSPEAAVRSIVNSIDTENYGPVIIVFEHGVVYHNI